MQNISSNNNSIDCCLQLTYLQRGVIKLLAKSYKPLLVEEIFHKLPRQPCGKKFVPQMFALEKRCMVSCNRNSDNCMKYKYNLTPDGWKIARLLNYL